MEGAAGAHRRRHRGEHPGHPGSKAPGGGFPQIGLVALFALACGAVLDAGMGPSRGKQSGENALLRTIVGSVLLTDRYFRGGVDLALWRDRRVDVVPRLHQKRATDFRRGRRLGPGDHVVRWPKGPQPGWMDRATYLGLPDELVMREVRVRVAQPGFRTRLLVVVATLTDPAVTADELAELYRARWQAETNLAHLKTTLGMDVLRCETEAGVAKELVAFAIVYNLVRVVMLEAGRRQNVRATRISFVDALRWLSSAPPGTPLPVFVVNPVRRSRVEPRCQKRRAKKYPYMIRPRRVLREELRRQAVVA